MNSVLNKQFQQVTKVFTDLSWHEISQHFFSRLLLIVVTIILFFILLWLGRLIIDHLFVESNHVKILKSSTYS